MSDGWVNFCIIAGLLFVGCVSGFFIGRSLTYTQAIEAGAGRWTINERTGESKFEFIAPKPEAKQ